MEKVDPLQSCGMSSPPCIFTDMREQRCSPETLRNQMTILSFTESLSLAYQQTFPLKSEVRDIPVLVDLALGSRNRHW